MSCDIGEVTEGCRMSCNVGEVTERLRMSSAHARIILKGI